MKTDILYILKPEEGGDYGDLRLSLRCLAADCYNVGRVYIVGGVPDWVDLRRVTCVPHEDCHNRKHKNILDAIVYAVGNTDVGKGSLHGMFMLSSDDHFYIHRDTDMGWGRSPVWFNGNIHREEDLRLVEKNGGHANGWLKSMVETRGVLTREGHNVLMFSQHANTWFSRELMEEKGWGRLVYEAQSGVYGCEPSCLMGNYMLTRQPGWIGNLRWRRDLKIGNDMDDLGELASVMSSERECVSGSQEAAGGNLRRVLERMFKEKCRYER